MALKNRRWAAASAVAAAFSMLATPVAAADLPSPAHARAYDPSVETVRRHRHWRHRDGIDIDAGDVLAGVLILGGIAAIAGAVEKAGREDDYPPPPPRPEDPPRYRIPGAGQSYGGSGMDRAVDMCVAEVERGSGRVGAVDGANRNGEGWQVSGALANGRSWSCWIGNDGRISGVDVDQGSDTSPAAPAADGQWSDEAYLRAREALDRAPYQSASAAGLP